MDSVAPDSNVLAGLLPAVWWGIGVLLLWVLVPQARAQTGASSAAAALTSEERPLRISVRPTYQRFEDENRLITETSIPIEAVIPFRDRWQVRIQGSAAQATGDDIADLSGITDVRAALSYARPVGGGSVIVSASVNVPTGKQELTGPEFITATLLSQNFYRFRVPSFGQGPGAGTGVTWAVPVAESVVLGLGGSVTYHGSYDPVAEREAQYDPGEEGRITGGIDVNLTRNSALSGEVSLVVYGTDTVGGNDQFTAGNQFSARVQYLRQVGEQTLRVVGHYREQEKSTLPARDGAEFQVLPTQGVLRGRYSTGLADEVDLRVYAAGRWYDETSAFESKRLVTLGAEPRFQVGDALVVSPHAAYTAGSFTGLEGGVGLEVRR